MGARRAARTAGCTLRCRTALARVPPRLVHPKALIFFGAVLPQFLRPDRSPGLQFVEVAATFLALELTVTTLAAAGADRLVSAGTGRALARVRGAGGLLLAGTAVFLAFTALR